jgi:hypothetical protein
MRIGDRSGHLARRRWRVVSMAVLGAVAGAAQAGNYAWSGDPGNWFTSNSPPPPTGVGYWQPAYPATGIPGPLDDADILKTGSEVNVTISGGTNTAYAWNLDLENVNLSAVTAANFDYVIMSGGSLYVNSGTNGVAFGGGDSFSTAYVGHAAGINTAKITQDSGYLYSGNLLLGEVVTANYFLNGGTVVGAVTVGYSSTGSTFSQTGGVNNTFKTTIAANASSTGAYNLTGGNMAAFDFWVGDSGAGTFSQSTGSTSAIPDSFYLGYASGGSGT